MTNDETLRFHPDVEPDLRDSIGWYTGISSELANRFRAMVNASLDEVAKNPTSYSIVFDDVRLIRVRTFPYLVQYRIVNNVPQVLGIFHSASDPEKWRKRAVE